jgi:hypothetical protein
VPLSLTRRNVKGSALTAAEHDSNLDKLETGVEGGASPSGFWIDASEFIPRTTAGCGIDSQETATNRINRDLLAFDPGANEHAQVTFWWPAGWSTARLTYAWEAAGAGGNLGTCTFGARMRMFSDGDAEDQAFGTAQTVTDTAAVANTIRLTSATAAVTPAGTVAAGRPCTLEIYRDVTDSLDVDALLWSVLVEKAS